MLNEGNYRGRPVRAVLSAAKTGTHQVAVEFELVDPPATRRTWFGFLSDAAFDRTIEALRACGWTGTDLTDFTGDALPAGFDQEVELVIKHEEYEGKTRDRIAFVNSGGGMSLKSALSQDAAKAFAAQMKGRIIAADRAAGRTVAPSGRAPAARPAVTRPPARMASSPPRRDEPPLDVLEAQSGGAPDANDSDVPF